MKVRVSLVAIALIALVGLVRAEEPASKPAKQPIDYKKLKELMPEKLGDQPRQSNEGEKVSAGAMAFSHATAEYRPKDPVGDNSPSINLEIIDYNATESMAEAATAWAKLEIDRDSDSGYEKTTKIAGFPAYESFQKEGKSGQVQLFVAGRYYVNLQTSNIDSEQMKKIAESLPVAKLAELK